MSCSVPKPHRYIMIWIHIKNVNKTTLLNVQLQVLNTNYTLFRSPWPCQLTRSEKQTSRETVQQLQDQALWDPGNDVNEPCESSLTCSQYCGTGNNVNEPCESSLTCSQYCGTGNHMEKLHNNNQTKKLSYLS